MYKKKFSPNCVIPRVLLQLFLMAFMLGLSLGATSAGIDTYCSGSIGDYIWHDANRKGIQDKGINGVEVLVTSSAGNQYTVTTYTGGPLNQPGYYLIDGLCADIYNVEVNSATVPAGMNPTLIEEGGDPTVDSNDPAGTPVTLPTDDSEDITIDFGYQMPCSECEGKVTMLTLQYNGSDVARVLIEQKKGGVVFNEMVFTGRQFTFSGTDKKDTLGTEISIFVNGILNTNIHTSGSKPIGPGLISGEFEVIESYSLNGCLMCPVN